MTEVTEKIHNKLAGVFSPKELSAIIRQSSDIAQINKFIRGPAHKRRLEIALDKAERAKKLGSKKHIFVAAKPRALSPGDISAALRRTQLEFIPTDFLHFALVNHFAAKHSDLLVEFLHRVGISCDDNGRVHQEYLLEEKYTKANALDSVIKELLEKYPARLILQYFVSLQAFQNQFTFLSSYAHTLRREAEEQDLNQFQVESRVAQSQQTKPDNADVKTTQESEIDDHIAVDCIAKEDEQNGLSNNTNLTEADPDSLTDRWDVLRHRLKRVVTQIEEGIVPDPTDIVPEWTALHGEIRSRQLQVGLQEDSSLAELKLAESESKHRSVIDLLNRLQSIDATHPNFSAAVEIVKENASGVVLAIKNDGAHLHAKKIAALSQLLAYVERGSDDFSLDAITDLHQILALEIHSSVATAALVSGFVMRDSSVVERELGDCPDLDGDRATEQKPTIGTSTTTSSVDRLFQTEDRDLVGNSPSEPSTSSKASDSVPYSSSEAQLSYQISSPRKFQVFRDLHWIGRSSKVEPAPWHLPGFSDRLNANAKEILSESELASVFVLQKAVEVMNVRPVITTASLADCADILQGGLPKNSSGSRLTNLRDDDFGSTQNQILMALEAIAPGDDLWNFSDNLQHLVKRAGFSSHILSRTIAALLMSASNGISLISHLRNRLVALDKTKVNGGSLTLEKSLSSFEDTYKTLKTTSIRGLRTEHCRAAWKIFLDSFATPIAKIVLTKPLESIDLDHLRRLSTSLEKDSEALFEDSKAKFEDRAKMERDVREISLKVSAILSLLREERQSNMGADSIARFDLPSTPELKALGLENISSPAEAFCRTLIFSMIAPGEMGDPLTLVQRDLLRRPELALYLGLDEPLRTNTFKFDVRKLGNESVLSAAAVLLQPSLDVPPATEIASVLKDRLIGIHRLDVMSMYLGDQALNASERSRLQRQLRDNGVERADAAFQKLEDAWIECDALASNRSAEVRTLVNEAKEALDTVESQSFGDTALLVAWIEETTAFCVRETDKEAEEIRKEIARNAPERLKDIEYAISARRFWELDASLDNTNPVEKIDEPRWIPWRTGIDRDSDGHADGIRSSCKAYGGELLEFSEAWLEPNPTDESKRQCRKLFYSFISGEMASVEPPKRRTKQQSPFLREFKSSRIVIDCISVLQMLEREGHNPTFVPQFSSFKSIVILSAPMMTGSRLSTTPTTLATFVNSELHKDEDSASGNLAVVLMPRLSSSLRDDILDEFHRRQKAFVAVLVDDNDIFRLLGKGKVPPADIRPFLEVILEQLPLANSITSPYSSQDGQHTRREMFVGRADDAKKLATTSNISRVFSGRKLGKSAFLKNVARTFDNSELPSKNTLHVLFVSIAGGDSEGYLEDRVVSELLTKFPSLFDAQPGGGGRLGLIACIDHIVRIMPKVSLLLLLDEADSFVEEQLRSYDRNREKCLSFKLMKEVSQHTDILGLPRVRVVFSGYRVTNTRDGAWANAGEVLILSPLEKDEAVNLIEGPLARLGIDVTSQSAFIAKRCGNQPAILNRFGDTLIKYLRNTRPLSRKAMLKVESSQVGAAFNDPSIAAEIRTVMFNNFQGDAAGQVIFAAALLAFSKLTPGLELSNAAEAILEQITLIDSNLDWLEKRDPSLVGEIEHYLRDFEDRLLIYARHSTGAVHYRLKVGHSMPILLAGDLPGQIRRAVVSLRDGHNGSTSSLRCVFPDAQLDKLRKAYKSDLNARTVVVTGNWPAALEDTRVGIPDRLGIPPSEVHRWENGKENCSAITGANAAALELVLANTPSKHLIIGGTDVARRMIQLGESYSDNIAHWQSLGRVPELGVKWWFEQLRMFQFETTAASQEIAKLTGQIPILLKAFDALLLENFKEEAELSHPKFQNIVRQFNESFNIYAGELETGSPATRLERREIEVLILICTMAREYETLLYPDDFTEELWRETAASKQLNISAPAESDAAAVELLQRLGLIKIDAAKGIVFDKNSPDPIFAIVDQLKHAI